MSAQDKIQQLAQYVLSQNDIERYQIAPISLVYLKIAGKIYGPFQDEKLRDLIPEFREILAHAMLRTGANQTWMFFFEHPLYDRRSAEIRFAANFDWKNATFSYLEQGQKSPPLSLAKLKHYVASGQLKPLDHVCIEPGATWAKICQLPFFNRRGKKNGMALPGIPDEGVFEDATRIAIARVNQEEHLDATLGEILSANEKANDPLANLTTQILGRKKSTIVASMLSIMLLAGVITALLTPTPEKARPKVASQNKTTAPMARVIGVAEGLGTKAKTLAFKTKNALTANTSAKTGAKTTSPKNVTRAARGIASVATSAKSKAAAPVARHAATPRAVATPKQYKVSPIKSSATTVFGNPTRRPHLLPENERHNLDYDGTSYASEDATFTVYDQDRPEENTRHIAAEDEYGELEGDDENGELDDSAEPSLREKMFIKKMRKAFQEQARKKKREEEHDY